MSEFWKCLFLNIIMFVIKHASTTIFCCLLFLSCLLLVEKCTFFIVCSSNSNQSPTALFDRQSGQLQVLSAHHQSGGVSYLHLLLFFLYLADELISVDFYHLRSARFQQFFILFHFKILQIALSAWLMR